MSDPTSLERQSSSRSADLARVSPESGSPDFFEIQVANRPAPVRIEYAAIRELHRQLDGGGESVGLLVGTSTPDAHSIQRCEVLAVAPGATSDPKSLLGAFRQSLEARSQADPANAPQLLGCFRTQVAGWPGMKEADLGMVKRAFPGSDCFFVLIRTTSHRPWLAALYSLDAKTTTLSVEPALEFPFDEYLLRKGYLTDLVATPDPVEVQEQPKKSKTPWIIAGLVFAILLAGSAAAYKLKWFRSADQTDVVTRNAPAPALNLKVNRSGKDFEVSWDRLSAAVQQSSGGMLTITDGALTRPVALNASQLREGRILYTPLFEELNFRLEVTTPDSGTAAESVQVLAWSGKQPADVLTVAPPDPLANLPARVVAVPASPTQVNPKPAAPPAKSLPAPVANNLKQPPAGKQTQPAKPTSIPETVAVIQPSPSNSAPSAPARVPDTPAPAAAPERTAVAQPSPQVPANTPPLQPPVAPAPKPEAPVNQNAPVTPAPSQPASAIAPSIISSASPAPVSVTPTSSPRIVPPVPVQRVNATLPSKLPSGVAAGLQRVISVRVMVDSAGSVQSAEVTASNPKGAFGEALLKNAAVEAAKQWKFRPGQVDGKNVAAEYSIDFKF
jgi:TonB family protein